MDRRVVALILAVLASILHFREVAATANTGGRGILLVTAPVAFVAIWLATLMWFRKPEGD
jgi:hypothetical protein